MRNQQGPLSKVTSTGMRVGLTISLILISATALLHFTAGGTGSAAAHRQRRHQSFEAHVDRTERKSLVDDFSTREVVEETRNVYGKLPLAFVPNAGQTDSRVRYYAQAMGANFYFTTSEAVIALTNSKKGHALRLSFVGANKMPQLDGVSPNTGKVNYLIDSNPAAWLSGIPTYGEIIYHDLWPGIDLAFRGENGELKYEFRLAPGADPAKIRLVYHGVKRLSVDQSRDLRIHTALGVLRDSRPVSYQEVGATRIPVESHYSLAGNSYGFTLGSYDPSRPLVIDPSLAYSTYLGGGLGVPVPSTDDSGEDIAVDALGNAYVTGFTLALDFPTTAGSFDPSLNCPCPNSHAFVTKLNATGTALVYSTYLGGVSNEQGHAIAVDPTGNAYVTGDTSSTNFPTTPGAFDTSPNGSRDAFVTKLDATGATLLYSTYLGAFSLDLGLGIAVEAAGNVYITGETASTDFPTTERAFDRTFNGAAGFGGRDVFVTKLDATGATLIYSTFLGGNTSQSGQGIAIDSLGNAYVTGVTNSTNFPTTLGAFDRFRGGNVDAFVAKFANQPPTAAADAATTDEDNAITISVLANDTDADGDQLTLSDATQGANGSVVVNADNTVTYSPLPNFNGTDSFTYSAVDTWGDTDTSNVTVTINPVNDSPVASDNSAMTDEDLSVQINLVATDIDSLDLTFAVVSGPTNGTLSAIRGSSVTYAPNTNFNGPDSFTFKAHDGMADSNVATISIAVAAVNDPPDAVDDAASTDEEQPVTVAVRSNDTDVEGDLLTVTAVAQGAHGSVAIIGGSTDVSYTPVSNFFGIDSFTYTVSDGNGGIGTATVNITVTNVQNAPSATDDAATVSEDSGANTINVLANDSDADGNPLTIASATQGAHGAIVNNGASVSYTPAANYFGPDSFTYTVADGQSGFDTEIVNVTVTSVNDAPVANSDAFSTNSNTAQVVPAPGVLANDADIEGGPVSATLVTNVSNGTLALATDGSFAYTPHPNFGGADSFTYRAFDGTADSNLATVQINVIGTANKIVFSSTRDGNFEIYSMNPDGTGQARLTTHSAVDAFPAWSPDRTRIAFTSNRAGNFEIYVMNADGGSPVRLTTNGKVDGVPAWSPDGTKIAFSSNRRRSFEIYLMNADGTTLTRLTDNSFADVGADWSPDGTKIVFTSTRNGNFEIYVMNADGSGQSRLTNNPALDGEPAWSLDGLQIVLTSHRDGNFEIYVMNTDGSGLTRLTTDPAADTSPG